MTTNISSLTPSSFGVKRARRRRRDLRGRREEVASLRLGRYPFLAGLSHHERRRRGTIQDITLREELRKLREFARVFEEMKRKGEISTTDPRHMDEDAVRAFMGWMKSTQLDPGSQQRYLTYLKKYLETFDNFVIDRMKRRGVRFPKAIRGKPIKTLEIHELREIFQATEEMTGWNGSVMKGVAALCMATGIRPSEARRAHFEDLNMGAKTFYVRYPKGLGSWASPETIGLIREDVLPFLWEYTEEREDYLAKHGFTKVLPLFPHKRKDEMVFYSISGFSSLKDGVAERTGLNFTIKDFRSTFTTLAVNNDLTRLGAARVQLRHETDKTITDFYAKIVKGQAVEKQLRDKWKENPIIPERGVIDRDFPPTGYA